MIELFTDSYNEEDNAFADAEWDFFKDIVDEYAGELQMELVTSIMQLILAHGRI